MNKIVCTVCPKGCEMQVIYDVIENTYHISGNGCKRGKEYAINEMKHPMRTLQTTVKSSYKELPMIPVKTDGAIPKEMIFAIMKEVSKVSIGKQVKSGEVIIEDVLGTGVNIISTINMNLYLS